MSRILRTISLGGLAAFVALIVELLDELAGPCPAAGNHVIACLDERDEPMAEIG